MEEYVVSFIIDFSLFSMTSFSQNNFEKTKKKETIFCSFHVSVYGRSWGA